MIAENLQKLIDIKADIKNAINGKGGSVGERFEDYAPAIESLPSGGGVSEEDLGTDTIFVDHTGKIVARFSPEEIMDWTDFSAVNIPTYAGLRFVKFTHTLAEIQNGTWNDVGLCYEPEDGNTHIFVENCKYFPIVLSTSGAAQIDWGDGNIAVISSAVTNYKFDHTYTTAGNYEIVLNGPFVNCRPAWTSASAYSRTYGKAVTALHIASTMTAINPTALGLSLKYVVMPVNSTFSFKKIQFETLSIRFDQLKALVFDTNQLTYNYANLESAYCPKLQYICAKKIAPGQLSSTTYSVLKSLCCRYGLTTSYGAGSGYSTNQLIQRICYPDNYDLGANQYPRQFQYTSSLIRWDGLNMKLSQSISFNHPSLEHIENQEGTLFDYLTTIDQNKFGNMYNWKGTVKFSNITSINNYGFTDTSFLETIDFTGQTVVPTLASTTAFQNNTATFLIPDALFDTWIASTNWANMYTLAPDRFIRV